MKWMLLPIKRHAQWYGRSSRIEFWMFVLLQLLYITAVGLIVMIAEALTSDGTGDLSNISSIIFVIALLPYSILFVTPTISLIIRRWHDLDQTGWLMVPFALIVAIPVIGWIVFIVNLVWFCQRGTVGPNIYGKDPYDQRDDSLGNPVGPLHF